MLNKKEIFLILASTLILAFAITIIDSLNNFVYFLIAVLIVILLNVAAKKIAGFRLDSEVEVGLWEVKRYGFKTSSYFKKPVPMGFLLPIITSLITLGNFIWMSPLVFEVKAKVYKAARRHGLYSFSEMTESQIGTIAAVGIATNLIFALVGYLTGFSEFARISIFYAAFNMLPISDLDGNKIFFGNLVLWSFLATITLIALGYVFLLV